MSTCLRTHLSILRPDTRRYAILTRVYPTTSLTALRSATPARDILKYGHSLGSERYSENLELLKNISSLTTGMGPRIQ